MSIQQRPGENQGRENIVYVRGNRRRNVLIPMLLAATVGTAACEAEDPATEDAATERTVPAPGARSDEAVASDSAAAGARAALPTLFSIMVGLQGDMALISRGLWVESYDTIAEGARGIAEHPEIPPSEGQRIAEVLGNDMARFQALDRTVHDLSVQLAEEAAARDLDAIMETDAALRQACVECHTDFRDRLRAEIGAPVP